MLNSGLEITLTTDSKIIYYEDDSSILKLQFNFTPISEIAKKVIIHTLM